MYEKTTLPNGVRIVWEKIPHVRSVSMGIWVGVGSRYETTREAGASHFIEHMLFKGTESRSASELASIMDGIGGQVNAFTTKECTCLHGRVLDTHLGVLTDVLSDMFFHSKFAERDIQNERGVIFEEIDMYRDTPEDLTSERLTSAVFRVGALGKPILGKKSALRAMTGESLCSYMSRHYRGESVVIALSGNVSSGDIDRISDRFSGLPGGGAGKFRKAEYAPAVTVKRKSLEQNHICLGFPGIRVTDGNRFTMQLLIDILGGGMSSRLFQKVREERGLCYTICAYGSSYRDAGLLSVYTALGQETEREALGVIVSEIGRLCKDGVTEDELTRAREQVKVNILMGLESTGTRMNRLGRNELFFGTTPTVDEIIARYEAVTPEDIQDAARRHLDFEKVSLSVVGKADSAERYMELLHI